MNPVERRLDYKAASLGAVEAMRSMGEYVKKCGLEESLLELVKIRASQINGCAHCLDMHTKDARARGETEQRLYLAAAWREAPVFTERERAALEWSEAVTRIDQGHVPDDVYQTARKYFTEKELVDLTLAIVSINGYNRLNIAFRTVAGTYQPLRLTVSTKPL
jgi:AhpD family alkylhydroperoxidase